LSSSPAVIAEIFHALNVPELLPARYNIAPSQEVAAVRADRQFALLKWGLQPGWMKDAKIKPINAQSETAATKPMFRSAFKKRRCLVPADGWYEWKKLDAKRKQPYFFGPNDGKPLAFAGLWESFEDDGELVETCAILTTAANELVSQVHNRMPVILAPGDFDQWLNPANQDVQGLLLPFPADALFARMVSTFVNKVQNQGPECIASWYALTVTSSCA
jgi:putative SOS response-associated peptidase YedK